MRRRGQGSPRLRPAPLRALLLVLAVAGCAPVATETISSVRFPATIEPRGVARSNADIGADFLELMFGLESGEKLERLLRYERPIRIYVASAALAPYRPDLDALIARLRAEAGLDIGLTATPAKAQLRLEAVPAAQLARVFPSAACFIVPGEDSWRSFVRRRGGEERLRWSAQRELEGAAIFLPSDGAPQDVRDCLHEEITQALGPANDLYRLPDTVWNDDNFHGVATRFDMLILRALYAPELRSGMTPEEVAAALPAILARENPQGRRLAATARHPESRAWASAIEVALSRRADREARLSAALLATQIAAEMRPPDHRLSVSLLTLGRLTLRQDRDAAARYFEEALAVSVRRSGPEDIRTAHAAVHVAAAALAQGNGARTIALAERYVPVAARARNAILIAGFRSLEAEALLEAGDEAGARAARLDSLQWARYGFGDADGALAREQLALAEIIEIGADQR